MTVRRHNASGARWYGNGEVTRAETGIKTIESARGIATISVSVNFSLKSEATERPGTKNNRTKATHPSGRTDMTPANTNTSQISRLK